MLIMLAPDQGLVSGREAIMLGIVVPETELADGHGICIKVGAPQVLQ